MRDPCEACVRPSDACPGCPNSAPRSDAELLCAGISDPGRFRADFSLTPAQARAILNGPDPIDYNPEREDLDQ